VFKNRSSLAVRGHIEAVTTSKAVERTPCCALLRWAPISPNSVVSSASRNIFALRKWQSHFLY
jgi:hypothetical protein